MHMMTYADEHGKDDAEYCISWLSEGKSFMVRDPEKFTRDLAPLFFKHTKFSSFTRKLYRWGFRQINRGSGVDDPIVFGNDNFQRDSKSLMKKMKSVTSTSASASPEVNSGEGVPNILPHSDYFQGYPPVNVTGTSRKRKEMTPDSFGVLPDAGTSPLPAKQRVQFLHRVLDSPFVYAEELRPHLPIDPMWCNQQSLSNSYHIGQNLSAGCAANVSFLVHRHMQGLPGAMMDMHRRNLTTVVPPALALGSAATMPSYSSRERSRMAYSMPLLPPITISEALGPNMVSSQARCVTGLNHHPAKHTNITFNEQCLS